jgi:hypothetical protein
MRQEEKGYEDSLIRSVEDRNRGVMKIVDKEWRGQERP